MTGKYESRRTASNTYFVSLCLFPVKKLFENFLAAVSNDELTHKYKGFTVMTEDERYESLRHCRYVDEVICDAPWAVTPDFIELHKVCRVAVITNL